MSVFAGQRVLITGGSSGIGKELARQWIERQAHVTIDTTGLGIDQVVARLVTAVRERDAARV